MIELKYEDGKHNLKLPKNIRQVGKSGEDLKIYIEDYVITYLNQINNEVQDKQSVAVLLGQTGKNNDDTIVFIHGASIAEGVSVQDDEVVFTSEIWTKLYDEIAKYFHDTQIVGWFLTRPGKSLGINDKLMKSHVDNFPGEDKVLFITDSQEHDEAFYIYKKGELIRQYGYYIYYERNEDMQNYMVDHKTGKSTEDEQEPLFFKKRVKQAEDKAENGSDSEEKRIFPKEWYKGMKRAASLAATFVALFAIIYGFSYFNKAENSGEPVDVPIEVMQGVKETNQTPESVKMQETESGKTASEKVSSENSSSGTNVSDIKSSDKSSSGENSTGTSSSEADTSGVSSSGNNSSETEKSDDVKETVDERAEAKVQDEIPVQNVVRQYEVKFGDTLAGISEKFYQSYEYIEVIQEMNQIEDPDKIYPGMMLSLP